MIGLLFDIDGTLLDTQGQGADAFKQAVHDTWETEDDLSWIQFSGATDLGVLGRIARRCGIDTQNDKTTEFFNTYSKYLRQSMDPTRVQLKPGVFGLLESLEAREDIALGLVTGNARETAYIKVDAGGIGHFFPDGGFGDEHPDRAKLVGFAREKMTDRVGECHEMALIGDTPNDINAAVENNIHAIGVATGRYSMAELSRTHPKATAFSDLASEFTNWLSQLT